jgi:hypothetical protein
MGFARSTVALLGTDATTGVTIANTATTTGSTFDAIGNDTSDADGIFYLCITSTVTVGTIDVKINSQNTSSTTYSKVAFEFSILPTNGTQRIPLGRRAIGRYLNVEVRNNATGASATNVTVLCEIVKVS